VEKQTSSTEKTFVVFPKKTYKTVSVYVADENLLSSREARSIVNTLPIVPEETIQERKANETMRSRVEKVVQFEIKLAEIGDHENLSLAGSDGTMVGAMIQQLLLHRNTNFDPIKLTNFTSQLNFILQKTEESVLSDYMLLNTVMGAGADLIKQSDQFTSRFCADIVYQNFHRSFQAHILLPVLTENSVLSSKLLEFLLKESWVPNTSFEALQFFDKSFEYPHRSEGNLAPENTFIENLLDPDYFVSSNDIYYDLLLNLINTDQKNGMEHQNDSLILKNTQSILKIFLTVIQVETEKHQFEEVIETFNKNKKLNVTDQSFVIEASFFLTLSFADKILDNLAGQDDIMTAFISLNCDQSMDREQVEHMVKRACHFHQTDVH